MSLQCRSTNRQVNSLTLATKGRGILFLFDMMKQCIHCQTDKPLCEFYAHPQMGDKLLNKCKDCCKFGAEERRLLKMKDPLWEMAERARHREKSRKYRLDGRAKSQAGVKRNNTYPIKQRQAAGKVAKALISGKVKKRPCGVCSSTVAVQGHHEDYDHPLYLNWLCVRHHADRHIHLRDSETLNQTSTGITQWIRDMKTKVNP